MRKYTFIIILLCFCSLGLSQGDVIFTGQINDSSSRILLENESLDSIEPVLETDQLQLSVLEVEKNFEEFKVYSSYIIKVNEGKIDYINLYLNNNEFESWTRSNDFERYEYRILKDNGRIFSIDDSNYRGVVHNLQNKTTFNVIGSEDIHEKYVLSIHPSGEDCGNYWEPNESFKEVEKCPDLKSKTSVKLSKSPNNTIKKLKTLLIVLGALLVGFIVAVVVFKFFKSHKNSKDVKTRTNSIIKDMKKGKIPVRDETLKKVYKANEKALNGNKEEARILLNEIEYTES